MAPARQSSLVALALLSLVAAGSWRAANAQYGSISSALQDLNLTSLASAIDTANLTNVVTDPTTQVILLAPTDGAFARLLNATNITSAAEIPIDLAQVVLLYHVIPTDVPNAFLNVSTFTTLGTALQNLDGFGFNSTEAVANVTFLTLTSDTAYVGGVPPGAIVNFSTSYTAGQSRIYLVENVLLPPARSLLDPPLALTAYEELTQLPNVTLITGLLAASPNLLAAFQDPDLAVTIFAPTDDAIMALVGGDASSLTALAGTDAAARILRNHVVAVRPFTSGQIPLGVTVVDTASSVPDDVLTIVNENGTITVAGAGNESPATVIMANNVGGKSIIHVINDVILPHDFGSETSSPPDDSAAPPPDYSTPPPDYSTPPPDFFFAPPSPGADGSGSAADGSSTGTTGGDSSSSPTRSSSGTAGSSPPPSPSSPAGLAKPGVAAAVATAGAALLACMLF